MPGCVGVDASAAAADPAGWPGAAAVLAALLAGAAAVLVGGSAALRGTDLSRALAQEAVTVLAGGWASGPVRGARESDRAIMGGRQRTEDM